MVQNIVNIGLYRNDFSIRHYIQNQANVLALYALFILNEI